MHEVGGQFQGGLYYYIYHKNSNHSCRYISVILWVDFFYLHEWFIIFELNINVGKYTSLVDSSWHTDLGKTTSAQNSPGVSASAFGLWHAGGGNLHQIRGSSFSTCCLCFSAKIWKPNSWMTDDGKKVELLMGVFVFFPNA